ncbi:MULTISPECIES: DotA/TraY family protein [unclassified Variovorax]|uniref:DotA/TraY family protein n=1 Tax=unclassified Variovorax TaxID=663243 RepID=UPI0034E8F1C9
MWILLIPALLAAGQARAQGSNAGNLVQPYLDATGRNDMSTQAFTALLGQFFTNPFAALGSASTLLGSMFLVFNTFILVAGTIWATYGIGVAIVQTAHEGQLMGKRLSQVWLPIRMVTGVASLIPAFGGFSLSQAVLVFATTIGIGAANLGYEAMVQGTNNLTTVVSPSFVSPKAQGGSSLEEAAFTLFRARVCMQAQNDYVRQQQALGVDMSADTISATSPAGLTGVQYGKPDNRAFCGGIKVTANAVEGGRNSSSAVGYRVASVNYEGIARAVQTRATGNFNQYVNGIAQLADDWYRNYQTYQTTGGQRPTVPVLQLEGLATSYYTAIQPARGEADANAQALSSQAVESMKKFGWFGAGSWYATLAEVNAAVAQAAQSVNFAAIPMGVSDTGAGLANQELGEVLRALSSSTALSAQDPINAGSGASESSWQGLCRIVASAISPGGATPTGTGNCSLGQAFAMQLINMSTAGAGGATSTSGGELRMIDPIIAMKNMGDYLMVAAESLYVAYSYLTEEKPDPDAGVLDAATRAVKNPVKGVIGGTMNTLMAPLAGLASLLPMIVGGMFVIGLIMSLWIPMIPFVNWWGGLVQYLTIFFEGIAAAPIWAFVHLDANGEGMGQRTETGYLFIINMLFRPFLMLLGFVAAAALMMVMGSFLFWLYPSVMSNVQGNSITGIFSVLGFLLIFWILMHTLVTTLSNLSVVLPDQALAWAGRAIGAQLGRDSEHGMRGQFMAFGRVGQAAATVAPRPKGKGGAPGSRASREPGA